MRRRCLTWLSAPVVVSGLLLSLASCGLDTDPNALTGPTDTQPTGCRGCLDVVAVRVSPAQSSVVLGATVQLTADPVNAQGNSLLGRAIAWESSDEDIAKVTSVGVVSAFDVGSATISATTGGIAGTASVTVTAPPAPAGR